MAMRLTGISSGMDTDAMVQALTSSYQTKIDKAKGEQTKIQWKKDAWADLNKKLYSFYTGALSDLKSTGTYKTKKVASNDDSKVSFSNSMNAANGTHKLSIKGLASAAYLTGGKIGNKTVNATTYESVTSEDATLGSLLDSKGEAKNIVGSSFTVTGKDGASATITVNGDENTTIKDMVADMNQQLADQGVEGLEVSFEKGALKFTNTTAQVTEDEGKTYYEHGYNYTVKAADEDSQTALGIAANGMTVKARTSEKEDNITSTSAFAFEEKVTAGSAVSKTTKLSDLGIAADTTFTVTVGGEAKSFTIDKNTTLADLATQFSKMGVQANYDVNQGRFYINAADSGTEHDFTVTASDPNALATLGLDDASSTKEEAADATVVYNGVTYTQGSNNFSINGLNFTVKDVTETTDAAGNVKNTPLSVSVETDKDAVYNKIKNFVKEYNALIEEMNKLYSAESAKDYEPLTDEEKEAMSEKDIENWESKIKDSILRRDDTIGTLLSTMRKALSGRTEVTLSDGTSVNYGLSSIGIYTGNYSENGKLHIYGDAEDSDYSSKDNKLEELLSEDPNAVLETLTGIGTNLYTKFQKAMASSNLSSALTFYNDKEYDSQMDDYEDKMKVLQEKMTDAEDKYYKQFAAMESKLAEMNSQMSYISSMLG